MAIEKHYKDETFLARWISGELTPEELDAFKNSEDYPYFKKINQGAQALKAPAFDHESSLSRFKKEKEFNANTHKTIKLIPNWVYTTAAAVIIGVGVFFFMNNDQQYDSNFGEQLAITLPDNSKVQLNSNSVIEYNKSDWDNNRELHLKGEAFFDVEKGTSFKVVSEEGVVEVLGTEFNVVSRDGYFEVHCHEGKVRLTDVNNNELVVLTPGMAFRVIKNAHEQWIFQEEKPTWLSGESSFKDTPLEQVIKALENQFNIKIIANNVNVNKRFTGSFTHHNLDIATQTVFASLNIAYSTSQERTITLKEKH